MTRAWSKRNVAIGLVIGSTIALTVTRLHWLDNSDGFLEVLILNLLGAGFAVIVISCLPFLILGKAHFLCALKDLSLPIGLVMSCYGLVIFNIGGLKQPFYIAYVLPALAGGMLSLTLAEEVESESILPLGFFRALMLLLWIIVVCHTFHLLVHNGSLLWLLWHPWEWLRALLVTSLFCLYNPKKAPIHKRFGLGAIASIILAVSLSVTGVALATQSDNANTHGRSIAVGIVGMTYGLWLYISSIVVGKLAYNHRFDTNKTNWHLAEIFTFFIFLILAPRSLTEYFEPKQAPDSEQSIQATEADRSNNDVPIKENTATTDN